MKPAYQELLRPFWQTLSIITNSFHERIIFYFVHEYDICDSRLEMANGMVGSRCSAGLKSPSAYGIHSLIKPIWICGQQWEEQNVFQQIRIYMTHPKHAMWL